VIVFGSIVLILYLIAMGMLIFGYQKIPEYDFSAEENSTLKTCFSIIIPFRNEAENLVPLLQSILQLNYPKNSFEVLFVNDDSMDDSVKIILKELNEKEFPFRVINNHRKSASPKKDAITEAIKVSKHDWILTTDADCKLPKNWLLSFHGFIQKNNPLMIVGPVRYFTENGLINQYQQLDNFSLQTTTIGSFGLHSPLLCNGANLAYKKEEFNLVSGFSKNNHIASGDDVFLLEKFKNTNPKRVQFIKSKDAIVLTQAQESWKGIINQRIRWASKTTKQKDSFIKLLGSIVFLANLFVFIGLFICIRNPSLTPYFISYISIKIFIDYLVLLPTAKFFRTKINILYFLANTFIYPIITIIVVAKSLKGDYIWKGRTYN